MKLQSNLIGRVSIETGMQYGNATSRNKNFNTRDRIGYLIDTDAKLILSDLRNFDASRPRFNNLSARSGVSFLIWGDLLYRIVVCLEVGIESIHSATTLIIFELLYLAFHHSSTNLVSRIVILIVGDVEY